MKKIKVHATISGIVQGVGYRYNTYNQAVKLGITGWVKNNDNGNVEAIFEGDETLIETMLQWCKQGPSMAIVTNIDITRKPYTAEFNTFEIKR